MDAVREYIVDEYATLTGHEFDDIESAIVKISLMRFTGQEIFYNLQ